MPSIPIPILDRAIRAARLRLGLDDDGLDDALTGLGESLEPPFMPAVRALARAAESPAVEALAENVRAADFAPPFVPPAEAREALGELASSVEASDLAPPFLPSSEAIEEFRRGPQSETGKKLLAEFAEGADFDPPFWPGFSKLGDIINKTAEIGSRAIPTAEEIDELALSLPGLPPSVPSQMLEGPKTPVGEVVDKAGAALGVGVNALRAAHVGPIGAAKLHGSIHRRNQAEDQPGGASFREHYAAHLKGAAEGQHLAEADLLGSIASLIGSSPEEAEQTRQRYLDTAPEDLSPEEITVDNLVLSMGNDPNTASGQAAAFALLAATDPTALIPVGAIGKGAQVAGKVARSTVPVGKIFRNAVKETRAFKNQGRSIRSTVRDLQVKGSAEATVDPEDLFDKIRISAKTRDAVMDDEQAKILIPDPKDRQRLVDALPEGNILNYRDKSIGQEALEHASHKENIQHEMQALFSEDLSGAESVLEHRTPVALYRGPKESAIPKEMRERLVHDGFKVKTFNKVGDGATGEKTVTAVYDPRIVDPLRKADPRLRGMAATDDAKLIETALRHTSPDVLPALVNGFTEAGGFSQVSHQLRYGGKRIGITRYGGSEIKDITRTQRDLHRLGELLQSDTPEGAKARKRYGLTHIPKGQMSVTIDPYKIPKLPDVRQLSRVLATTDSVNVTTKAQDSIMALAMSGNTKAARQRLEKALQNRPRDERRRAMGEFDSAMVSHGRAVAHTPEEARALVEHGLNLQEALRVGAKDPYTPVDDLQPKRKRGSAASQMDRMSDADPDLEAIRSQTGKSVPAGSGSVMSHYGAVGNEYMIIADALGDAAVVGMNKVIGRFLTATFRSPVKGIIGHRELGFLGNRSATDIMEQAGQFHAAVEQLGMRWDAARKILEDPKERLAGFRIAMDRLDEVSPEIREAYLNNQLPKIDAFAVEVRSIFDEIRRVSGAPEMEKVEDMFRWVYDEKFAKAKLGDVLAEGRRTLPKEDFKDLRERLFEAESRLHHWNLAKGGLRKSDAGELELMPPTAAKALGVDPVQLKDVLRYSEDPDDLMPRFIYAGLRRDYLSRVTKLYDRVLNKIKKTEAAQSVIKEIEAAKKFELNPSRANSHELLTSSLWDVMPPSFQKARFGPRVDMGGLARVLQQMAFMKYIGLSLASGVVNLSQTPLNVGSVLGYRYLSRGLLAAAGDESWIKELAKRGQRIDLVSARNEVNFAAHARGDKFGRLVDLSADEQTHLKRLAGSAAGAGTKILNAMKNAASIFFDQAEKANIRATAWAAYAKMLDLEDSYRKLAVKAAEKKITDPLERDWFIYKNLDDSFKDDIILERPEVFTKTGRDVKRGLADEGTPIETLFPEGHAAGDLLREGRKTLPDQDFRDLVNSEIEIGEIGFRSANPMKDFRDILNDPTGVRMVQLRRRRMSAAINHLQHSYTTQNLPRWAREHGAAKAFLQFTDFPRQQLELIMNRMGPISSKAARWRHGKYWGLLGGIAGPYAIPFVSDLAAHSDGVKQKLDEWNEARFLGIIEDPFAGSNIAHRVGMNFIFNLGQNERNVSGTVAEEILNRLATNVPAVGVVRDPGRLLIQLNRAEKTARAGGTSIQAATNSTEGLRGRFDPESPTGKLYKAAVMPSLLAAVAAKWVNMGSLAATARIREVTDPQTGETWIEGPGLGVLEALPVGTNIGRLNMLIDMSKGGKEGISTRSGDALRFRFRSDSQRWLARAGFSPNDVKERGQILRAREAAEEGEIMAKARLAEAHDLWGRWGGDPSYVLAKMAADSPVPPPTLSQLMNHAKGRATVYSKFLKGLRGEEARAVWMTVGPETMGYIREQMESIVHSKTLNDKQKAMAKAELSEAAESFLHGAFNHIIPNWRNHVRMNPNKDPREHTNHLIEAVSQSAAAAGMLPVAVDILMRHNLDPIGKNYPWLSNNGLKSAHGKIYGDGPTRKIKDWVDLYAAGNEKALKDMRLYLARRPGSKEWPNRYKAMLFMEAAGLDPSLVDPSYRPLFQREDPEAP